VEEGGIRVVGFKDEGPLAALGRVPLPPYIRVPLRDPERYQTVYARTEGSAAAPTAGLHFTPALIDTLARKGVRCVFVTLHVGLDTFQPVREDDPAEHRIHREFGMVPVEAAAEMFQAKAEGRRVICVGTTAMRLVEAAAGVNGLAGEYHGWVDLFILPGYQFRVADAMITNFHLPRTTLLMLVSAFAGRELILETYREAVAQEYRFYSFGDAMLIL
jgi:S-adenosylmethionine:tRNA ribosyltransferase-isomerase